VAETRRRRIAIIGSANPRRNSADHAWPYDPPLKHPEVALDACEQLGVELARGGWDIVVYAGEGTYGEEGFIEPAVVAGYVSAGTPASGSIEVLYSRRYPTPQFPAQSRCPDAFDIHADLSDRWETSFYRSLGVVDAALIVGGGNSAYVAGLVCLGRRIPLLAIATFGAGGERGHSALVDAGGPLSREDLELLARPDWTAASARQIVASLDSQQTALEAESQEVLARQRSRRRSQHAWVALALFVVAALLIPTALSVASPGSWWEFALLFVAPLIAGASGGTIRTLLPRTQDVEISTVGSAALGAVAGGIGGLLYLTAQLTSSVDATLSDLTVRQYQTWVLFSVVIGFMSGLTLDAIYQRLINAGAAEARDL
jgi:hypothetical protein